MATTTKKQRDIMDSNVLSALQAGSHHGAVKWIRYAANRVERGETDSYPRGPYTEAQIRGSLKRLERAGVAENSGWSKARWKYITDEMIEERAAAAEERRKADALAEAVQDAIGIGVGEEDEDGDVIRREHVRSNGGLSLKLTPTAAKALAAKLGIDLARL